MGSKIIKNYTSRSYKRTVSERGEGRNRRYTINYRVKGYWSEIITVHCYLSRVSFDDEYLTAKVTITYSSGGYSNSKGEGGVLCDIERMDYFKLALSDAQRQASKLKNLKIKVTGDL